MANEIYLRALPEALPASIAESVRGCNVSAECVCPESSPPLIPDVFTVKSPLASLRSRVVASLPFHPLSFIHLTPVTLVVMNHSTESGHKQVEPGSQPRPEMPSNSTVQQMKDWDEDELLRWIQQKKPKLLSGDNLEKFIAAEIAGETFLRRAGDRKFFMDAGLPVGISQELSILSHGVKEGGEFIPWT